MQERIRREKNKLIQEEGDVHNGYHIPIMVDEIKEEFSYLNSLSSPIIVDATVGFGGHSKELLKEYTSLRIIGVDVDSRTLKKTESLLLDYSDRILLRKAHFSTIDKLVEIDKIDGILLDLGISTHQIKNEEYGMTYKDKCYLDMRMTDDTSVTAYEIVNKYPYKDLISIFNYHTRYSSLIGNTIIKERKNKEIISSEDLTNLLSIIFHGPKLQKQIRLVFQALRVYINDEYKELESVLSLLKNVKHKCKILILTYSSSECKIIRHSFKDLTYNRTPFHLPISLDEYVQTFKIKVKYPSYIEKQNNTASKSSSLYIIERL